MKTDQRRFTDQQLEMADSINIIAYAKSRGYELKRISNNSYNIPGYGGLFISGDGSKWNWFSQNKGGGAIQFVMEMEGKTWVDSVKELLGITHDELPIIPKVINHETKDQMVLPEKNDTYKHLFAYLIKGRGIDSAVVSEFVEKKMLYEDKSKNCVFVGFNEVGAPAYASRRSARTVGEVFKGDVRNSDKSWPFYHTGESNTLYVFESPIDLMSYLSLLKIYNINEFNHHMISLGGVADSGLMRFLDRHEAIETIVLCLDNDEAGTDACLRIGIQLQDQYQLKRHSPKLKDFNEDLLEAIQEANNYREREPPEEACEGEEIG